MYSVVKYPRNDKPVETIRSCGLSLQSLFVQLPDKLQKTIIWGDLVEDGFLALRTPVLDHISLILPVVQVDRPHLPVACGCPVSGAHVIHMSGAETEGAVIPC